MIIHSLGATQKHKMMIITYMYHPSYLNIAQVIKYLLLGYSTFAKLMILLVENKMPG